MMGHRERLKNGLQWDVFSRNSRRIMRFSRGLTKAVKRLFWKRQRARNRATKED